jgi:signal transduction histidine kinase
LLKPQYLCFNYVNVLPFSYQPIMFQRAANTFLIFILILSNTVSAQPVFEVKDTVFSSDLNGYLSVAESIELANDEQIINFKDKFEKVRASIANFGLSKTDNWIMFEVKNTLNSKKPLVLYLDQTFLEKADLFRFRGDSLIQNIPLNQALTLNQRPFNTRNFAFNFTLEPGERNLVFLRMKASSIKGVSRALVTLSDEFSFHVDSHRLYILFGVLTGFISLGFLAACLLYFFDKKRIYVTYGFYILAVSCFYLANGGYLNALYPQQFLGSARFEACMIWLMSVLHVLFVQQFLQLEKHLPQTVKTITRLLIISSLAMVLIYTFLPLPSSIATFSRILSIFSTGVVIGLGIWGYLKKHKYAQLYAIATIPSFLLIFYFLLVAFSLFPLKTTAFLWPYPLTVFEIIVFGFGLVYDFSESRRLIEQKLQAERLNVASRIIAAQEEERSRVSQDLHDDLGSTLSMLKFNLEAANKTLVHKIDKEVSITNKAIEDLRLISFNLMPTMLERLGLAQSIEEYVSLNNIESKVRFFSSGKERRLSNEAELSVFRIVKELLNNALKHAEAKKIELQLIYFQDFLFISVEDNGLGIKEKTTDLVGNGLKNINLRVNFLNGRLTSETSERGTQFAIEIPYESSKEENISG